jgi:hypothetical protein
MSSKSELLQFRDSTAPESSDVDLTDDIKGVKTQTFLRFQGEKSL